MGLRLSGFQHLVSAPDTSANCHGLEALPPCKGPTARDSTIWGPLGTKLIRETMNILKIRMQIRTDVKSPNNNISHLAMQW